MTTHTCTWQLVAGPFPQPASTNQKDYGRNNAVVYLRCSRCGTTAGHWISCRQEWTRAKAARELGRLATETCLTASGTEG